MSGEKHRSLSDLFQLPPGGMDLPPDNEHHRTAQQRVSPSDQGHGDCCWRNRLLSAPGLHIFKNGIALEVKPFKVRCPDGRARDNDDLAFLVLMMALNGLYDRKHQVGVLCLL